jgi:hypothetical protein
MKISVEAEVVEASDIENNLLQEVSGEKKGYKKAFMIKKCLFYS